MISRFSKTIGRIVDVQNDKIEELLDLENGDKLHLGITLDGIRFMITLDKEIE